MSVSQVEETDRGSVNSPTVDEASQPSPDNDRLSRFLPSAPMATHSTGVRRYRPLPQGPFPWSPYRLHRVDEARRALENIELHLLSQDACGRGTPALEYDLDLSDH